MIKPLKISSFIVKPFAYSLQYCLVHNNSLKLTHNKTKQHTLKVYTYVIHIYTTHSTDIQYSEIQN